MTRLLLVCVTLGACCTPTLAPPTDVGRFSFPCTGAPVIRVTDADLPVLKAALRGQSAALSAELAEDVVAVLATQEARCGPYEEAARAAARR